MKYIDELETFRENNWINFIKCDGIIKEANKDNILKIIDEEYSRILDIIKSRLPSLPTITMSGGIFDKIKNSKGKELNLFDMTSSSDTEIKSSAVNYFIINDIGCGEVCEKCGSSSYVLVLEDENYLKDLDKKVWLPSSETYYNLQIPISDIGIAFPVPANPDTDLWVCPICKEVHKFKYDNEIGLLFDQEVLK